MLDIDILSWIDMISYLLLLSNPPATYEPREISWSTVWKINLCSLTVLLNFLSIQGKTNWSLVHLGKDLIELTAKCA